MEYIGKTKFSKITSIVLTLTTVLWLSGFFAFVPTAGAVTIADGDVIKNPSAEGMAQFDVYIVKLIGAKMFKRLVLNPQVFESYGHLSWANVKSVDQATMDAYTVSSLVREDGGTKVYKLVPDGDVGSKEWLNMTAEAFVAAGHDWDAIYTVNSVDVGNYNVGDEIVVGGGSIALDAGTPAAGYLAASTYNNSFTQIKFEAGSTGYIVSSIAITRGGLSEDDDILDVKLYDGATQLGSAQSVNTLTHKATFSGLAWTIPANGSKILTVKVGLNGLCGSAPCVSSGNILKFGIGAASDIAVSSGTLPTATFPIYGNGMTVAGITVGAMEVMASNSVATMTLISGTTDQLVAGFNFEALSEAFSVNKIVISESGSAVSTDLKNLKLKVDGVQVGSTISSLTASEKAEFTGSPLFSIASGTNKDVLVYADIASGITSTRTVQFQIFETSDVEAIGSSSGGITLIEGDGSGTVVFSTVSSPSTASSISQGSLTVAFDTATNPADGTNTVAGATNILVQTFKFSANSNEGLNVNYVKFDLNTEGTDDVEMTDYSNAKLYINDETTPITTTGTIGSASVSFGTSGATEALFNIPKGGNTVAKLKVDISTNAANTERIGYYISAKTNLTVRGAGSSEKIPTDNMTITAVDAVGDAGAGTLNIQGFGALAIDAAPDKPAASNYSEGATGLTVFKARLTASSEPMTITMIKFRLWASSVGDGSDEAVVDDTDFTNAKLYDGATLLGTVSLASSIATFNLTGFQVAKDSTKTLSLVVDVPIGSDVTDDVASGKLYVTIGGVTNWGSVTTANELTTTGTSSLQAITETGSGTSNAFTEAAPTFTVAASTAPALKSVVTGATSVHLGKLLVTANNENIKVTQVKITADDAAALNSVSTADTSWSNIKIKVGGSDITGGGPKQLTSGTPDTVTFDGLNFTIAKDTTAFIDIYGDAVGTANAWYFGHAGAATGDITGSGISSGASVVSAASAYASTAVTITSAGTITVSVDADTTVSQNVAVGTGGKTGVTLSKIKFEATNVEDLIVKNVRITLDATNGGAAADFINLKLYDGATQIGATGFISGTTVDFINDAGLFTIGAGTYKVIAVKADLNGTVAGGDAISADGPTLHIADVAGTADGSTTGGAKALFFKVLGASSSSFVESSAGAGTLDPQTAGNFGSVYLYKSVPTVAQVSASSVTGIVSTAEEVYKFSVTADAAGDAMFNNVAFTVGGDVDLDDAASSNASLYKSTDLSNAVAVAAYVTGAAQATSGTVATGTTAALSGIPIGSTLIVKEAGGVFNKVKLTQATLSGSILTFTWTPDPGNIGANELVTIYYVPMQPGAGKLFFGGQTTLTNDLANSATIATVSSTDGFAPGDLIYVNGYTSAGVAVSDADGIQVTEVTSATLLKVADVELSATIDYDYAGIGGNAVVYVNTRNLDSDFTGAGDNIDALISETVAAGTSKTYIVKGDTSGANDTSGTDNDLLNFKIGNISDFNWDDTIRFGVTTWTAGVSTITGTSLKY